MEEWVQEILRRLDGIERHLSVQNLPPPTPEKKSTQQLELMAKREVEKFVKQFYSKYQTNDL